MFMFKSEMVPAVRRVTIELPEAKAVALADALNNKITWSETDVEDELEALYDALCGVR